MILLSESLLQSLQRSDHEIESSFKIFNNKPKIKAGFKPTIMLVDADLREEFVKKLCYRLSILTLKFNEPSTLHRITITYEINNIYQIGNLWFAETKKVSKTIWHTTGQTTRSYFTSLPQYFILRKITMDSNFE